MQSQFHRHCSCLEASDDDWRSHGRQHDAEPEREEPVRIEPDRSHLAQRSVRKIRRSRRKR